MPSMRCMMAAGKALDKNYVAGYHCSFRLGWDSLPRTLPGLFFMDEIAHEAKTALCSEISVLESTANPITYLTQISSQR